LDVVQIEATQQTGDIMKTTLKYVAPWLAAAAIGASIVLAPIASADTDPLVPHGSDPYIPYSINHDYQMGTSNGLLDLPS
jgi:hypothetical protein